MERRTRFLYAAVLILAMLLVMCAVSHAQGVVVGRGVIMTAGIAIPVVPVNCHMDGVTNDQPCLQAAVNLAASTTVSGGITYGAPVQIPCGTYGISSPVTLPRSALIAYPFGVVPVLGVSMNCVRIFELSGFPAGRGAFEWNAAAQRTIAQEIGNMTIVVAAGARGLFYQYSATNTPITNANATNERMELTHLHDIEFEGTGNPIYLQGDCYFCTLERLKANGTLITPTPAAEPVMIQTDTCFFSSAPNDEACGFTFGKLENIQAGGGAGGWYALFQGRLNQTTMSDTFCNGLYGGLSNSIRYQFVNSFGATLNNTANEGGAGLQYQFNNTTGFVVTNYGIGTPTGSNVSNGMAFVGSSRNTLTSSTASNVAGSSWQNQAPLNTFFRITLDSNSHNNAFYNAPQTGTTDITFSDTTTNYAQSCNAVTGCAAFFTVGTHP